MKPYFEELNDRLRISETGAQTFPEHLHTQVEMLYLFEGRVVMTVNGQAQRMEPGDLCVCFPGIVHGYLESENARALMLIFSPEISPDFGSVLTHSRPGQSLIRRAELPPDVEVCMEMMRREREGRFDERAMRGYIQVVLARTEPMLKLTGKTPEVSDIAYRVIKYLSERFAEPVTLETMSKDLGVSRSHLSHTFSQRLGTNFRTYVNALRIDQACEMLKGTEDGITHIAYECGFESQRTFNRVFMEQCGLSPSEYRRKYQEER